MRSNDRLEQGKKFLEVLKGGEKKQEKIESLKATKQRIVLTAKQLLRAYKPETIVVWRSFLVPTEIFYATGVLPFTPEMACAAIAPNQPVIRKALQRAEGNQYEPKLCSFLKTIIGGMYEGIMPRPNLVIGSPSFCNGIGAILHDVSRYYGSDFFYLNIPLDSDSLETVEYLANQLRKLTVLLCDKTGISIKEVEEERLPRVIEFSNQAAKYWKQIEELRQSIPSPMSGREALDYATVLAQTWGSEEIVEIYKLLYSELKERIEAKIAAIPNETLRLLWLHLRPYYSDNILEILEEQGTIIAFEEVNYPSRGGMDSSNPYRSLAREILLNSGQYRISVKRGNDLVYLAGKFKVDGVIHFSHDNCEWTKMTFPGVSNFLQREKGIPLLNLSGDCLVKERSELLRTRLQAFLEGLKAKKEISTSHKIKDRYQRPLSVIDKEYFVGIDVGAATTKALILNGREEILGWSIFSTGSDNRKTIGRVLREAFRMTGDLSLKDCKKIVATGVGRGNVPFAHKTITEITCHTEGMKHFFSEVKTIVDIGGQDTKVIMVDEARFRMNDACAAGTGKFLETIAHALGVNLEELAKLDVEAKKALVLSRMCTVFAESEVVNLVAKGSLLEEIVRGVHEMVADRTITLLRQLSPKIISPVAISGGVAVNKGVVRAIERGIGEKILVPDNPQLIGALGAAIIAAQNSISSQLPKT